MSRLRSDARVHKSRARSADLPRMELLGWIGLGIFCASSLAVGLRLLALWRQTRCTPELMAAIALLGIGPLGFALTIASGVVEAVSVPFASALWAFAALCLNVGTTAGYAFSQQVFHPARPLARGLVIGVALVLTGCWIHEFVSLGFASDVPSGPATRVSDWLRTSALGWGAFESLRYYTRLRRREALGLVGDGVSDRFLFWGLAMAGGGLSSGIDATIKLFVDRALDYPALTLLNATAGSIAGVFLYLAFLPRRPKNRTAPEAP